jgi:hypothetical protein
VSGSGVCDVWLPPHFRAPNDVVRYTTKELLDITAQYATDEEATGDVLDVGSREARGHSSLFIFVVPLFTFFQPLAFLGLPLFFIGGLFS